MRLIVFCNAVFSQSTSKICTLIRFTLFSNCTLSKNAQSEFYYLIDLHYSQTWKVDNMTLEEFYYLIDLHYSQTCTLSYALEFGFYYLIDLHYSQTTPVNSSVKSVFYYLIDLHYSQTWFRQDWVPK